MSECMHSVWVDPGDGGASFCGFCRKGASTIVAETRALQDECAGATARLAASEARVRELETTLLAIADGAAEASTDRTLSPGVVAYISVVEEAARAALAKSRARKRDGA